MPTVTAPAFTTADARTIARTHFGIDADATPLPSERDQNFLLASGSPSHVLKISMAGESRDLLECQHQAIALLNASGTRFRFPRLCASVQGEEIVELDGADGVRHWARVVDYLPGEPLARVTPQTPDVLREVGALLGTADRVLRGFVHPAAERSLSWDLQLADSVIARFVGEVAEPRARDRVQRVLSILDASAPLFDTLRKSIIHNDGNDYNIIVRPPTAAAPFDPVCVTGLIDFGDLVYSWTLAELAVGVAYTMLGKADPLGAAAHVVAGYHAEHPIPEEELAALFPLVLARLGLSATLAATQRAARPDNEYLSISESAVASLLERLEPVNADHAHFRFRAACGYEPCPASPRIRDWLGRHGRTSAPLLPDHDLTTARVLDFSVGSLEFGDVAATSDPARWTDAVFGALRDAGTRVGIGRYDEPRPWYTAPAFRSDTNEGPDWRTIHLGIDVFALPGTQIAAPFAGTVHSFRDNAGHLDYGPTIILQHDFPPDIRFYTLYGHLSYESLAGLEIGAAVQRGQTIATIGDATVNGGWSPHLHFQLTCDLLGRAGEFPGVGKPSERDLWLSVAPDPNLILGLPQLEPAPRVPPDALLAERAARFGPSLSIAYRKPLNIVRGWMQHLYDQDGQPYLDAVNNVAHVGHSHPHVVAALRRQAAVLNTNTRYLHENLTRYAERLTATLPDPLRVCFFVCSGSEANELALRLARAHTGATDVVVLDGAYHGNTGALIELSPYKFDGPGGTGRAPHVHVAPLPDAYRGRHRGDDAAEAYASDVHAAVERAHARGKKVAAFFVEPLPGCGGQIVPPPGYLAQAFEHARAAGAVCVADEVQTGMGRVGSHFWAFQAQGAVPDIVTIGKPIGNGHPIGAVVTTAEIAASFANGMEYFNTFGGNPVSCAVGMAVLDVIESHELQRNAREVGRHLLDGLSELQPRHEIIGDVRGQGLYSGIELVLDREARTPAGDCASYVANRLRERGILLSTDGPDHNVLKIKPPLVFTAGDADRLIETLDGVLSEDAVR